MSHKKIWIFLSLLAGIFACQKGMNELQLYTLSKPEYFPKTVYDFDNNQLTKQGVALGMKLFYDPILSADNSISCASCHIQASGFAHQGHARSHGIYNKFGTRNAPAIINLAWSPFFMHDGGIFDLDFQPIAPISNPVEMDETVEHVLEKLRANQAYKKIFAQVYGNDNITTANFLKALSQFMLTCVSADAKYDSVKRGEAVFTTVESQGYQLFLQHCNQCHAEPLFTDNSFRNNGIPINPSFNDKGRSLVTLHEEDDYKFKVPTLRNLAFTAPYMHDGTMTTLNDVFNHYTDNIQNYKNLDPLLIQSNGSAGITLTNEEQAAILSFLLTLNDYHFVTNKALAPE